MRGYHPTAVPADAKYDAETLGQDVLGLIEALGEKRAIVVGHDWGALAAYSAACQGPERVATLATVAVPHPASLRLSPSLLWAARHILTFRFPGAAARLRRDDFRQIDELVHRWSPEWKVPPEETRAVKAIFSEPGSLEAALGYYRALRPLPAPALRRRVRVPTVCFAGDSDVVSVREYERASSWFTSGYHVVRMPGGHFMHREYPERFVTELLKHCRRPPSAS
jgi:pimeloyl-ACP methyl ester carboxylesterase